MFRSAQLDRIENKLDRVITLLVRAAQKENTTMANLDKLIADVEAQGTVIKSAVALISGLRDELTDAGGNQAKIDEIVAKLDSQKDELAAAVATNTPAEQSSDTPAAAPAAPENTTEAPVDGSSAS